MSEENKCERCGATRWGSVGDMQKAVKAHNERCERIKKEGYLEALGDFYNMALESGDSIFDIYNKLKSCVSSCEASRAGKEG